MIFASESGNTIRIQCPFTDSSGELIDVDDLELRVYNQAKILLTTVSTVNRVSEGVYYALYTTPANSGVTNYYCEFHGTALGNDVVKRGKFQTRFWIDTE